MMISLITIEVPSNANAAVHQCSGVVIVTEVRTSFKGLVINGAGHCWTVVLAFGCWAFSILLYSLWSWPFFLSLVWGGSSLGYLEVTLHSYYTPWIVMNVEASVLSTFTLLDVWSKWLGLCSLCTRTCFLTIPCSISWLPLHSCVKSELMCYFQALIESVGPPWNNQIVHQITINNQAYQGTWSFSSDLSTAYLCLVLDLLWLL